MLLSNGKITIIKNDDTIKEIFEPNFEQLLKENLIDGVKYIDRDCIIEVSSNIKEITFERCSFFDISMRRFAQTENSKIKFDDCFFKNCCPWFEGGKVEVIDCSLINTRSSSRSDCMITSSRKTKKIIISNIKYIDIKDKDSNSGIGICLAADIVQLDSIDERLNIKDLMLKADQVIVFNSSIDCTGTVAVSDKLTFINSVVNSKNSIGIGKIICHQLDENTGKYFIDDNTQFVNKDVQNFMETRSKQYVKSKNN